VTTQILYEDFEISDRIASLSREIGEYYRDLSEPLVVIGVLDGAFIFVADLCRQITIDHTIVFIKASSYNGSTRGPLVIDETSLERFSVVGKRVLLIDDILDTGHTLNSLKTRFEYLGAQRVDTCVLLYKPSKIEVDLVPNFVGFAIPDVFVYGYGLDLDGKYRNLSGIVSLQ
jgi:hypoxanthine phosphoribosyltransferase